LEEEQHMMTEVYVNPKKINNKKMKKISPYERSVGNFQLSNYGGKFGGAGIGVVRKAKKGI
jgi:hypothetical protein